VQDVMDVLPGGLITAVGARIGGSSVAQDSSSSSSSAGRYHACVDMCRQVVGGEGLVGLWYGCLCVSVHSVCMRGMTRA
jgi:hypothetical protein